MGNTFKRIEAYKDDNAEVNISSFMTDHGGVGGTKEGSADQFEDQHPQTLYAVCYVVTCMLHGHSKPLENAWLTSFGDFGTDKRTVSQFIYQCWYIQDRLSSVTF